MRFCATIDLLCTMYYAKISIEDVFQALSDPTRLRIIRLLAQNKGEICSCELVDSLREPEYKISRHLKVLKSSGLITAERDGKWIYHCLIRDEKFLKSLHKAILEFPDTGDTFEKDQIRFRKRMKLRRSGRCQVGPLLDSNKVNPQMAIL